MTTLLPIMDITAIEQAVEARLVAKIAAIRATAVQKGTRFLFTNPALAVSIFETGEFIPEGQRSYKIPCDLHLLLTFSSAKSEEERRKGINPLVMGIIQALTHQTLGLKLRPPGLIPKRFSDVTTEEDWSNNKIIYSLQFGCAFNLEAVSDEVGVDLLTIGMNYFLAGDAETIQATDVVDFTTVPSPQPAEYTVKAYVNGVLTDLVTLAGINGKQISLTVNYPETIQGGELGGDPLGGSTAGNTTAGMTPVIPAYSIGAVLDGIPVDFVELIGVTVNKEIIVKVTWPETIQGGDV